MSINQMVKGEPDQYFQDSCYRNRQQYSPYAEQFTTGQEGKDNHQWVKPDPVPDNSR